MKINRTRSDRFLAVLKHQDVVVVAHTNPDPDAIAAGWGIVTLLHEKLGQRARLVAGGAIVRAENKHMVALLKPPIQLCAHLYLDGHPAVVLVDCNPTERNHLLSETDYDPVAVIDHHPPSGPRFRIKHRDIRTHVAATATIVSQYLREQGVEPSSELATALIYAVHTDALGWPVFSRTDQRTLTWLHAYADLNKLAEIQAAPLSLDYYSDLLLALQTTVWQQDAALCFLPRAAGAEIVGEVADLLIRGAPFERVLCAAIIEGDVLLSVRTSAAGGDAGQMVRKLLAGLGHGGGHAHRAGGRIPRPDSGSAKPAIGRQEQGPGDDISELRNELHRRWLEICGLDPQGGVQLVDRGEILKNL